MNGPEHIGDRQHFYANVRGHDVLVVGDISPADKSVGIFFASFEAGWLFDCDGVRLRALEDQLTDLEWTFIAEQCESQMEEDDDSDDAEVDRRLDEEAFKDE